MFSHIFGMIIWTGEREIIYNTCWGYICKNACVSVKWHVVLTVHISFLSAVAYMVTYLAASCLLLHFNPLTNQHIYTEVPSSLLLVTTVDIQFYCAAFRFLRKRCNRRITHWQHTLGDSCLFMYIPYTCRLTFTFTPTAVWLTIGTSASITFTPNCCSTAISFAPFCWKTLCQFLALLILRCFIFSLTSFGVLPSIKLIPYLIWEYHLYLHCFDFYPFYQELN